MVASLGKMPTTSVRRLTSPLMRSKGLARVDLGPMLRGGSHIGEHVLLGLVGQRGPAWGLGGTWSATWRHWALTASA